MQPKRSSSTSAFETSPDSRRARALARPISPSSSERRRVRTYSFSDSSSSKDEESSEDGEPERVTTSKKRRTTVATSHTSAFRGVSCCGKDRKFQARIRDGSKVHYLGRFDNEYDAALKYDEAARSHKGDSATPNFVLMTPEECDALRLHYFSNDQQVQPEFYRFLNQGTLERLEAKRSKKAARAGRRGTD